MIISHNWLKDYVDHDLTPEALAEALTMLGLEVEEVERIGTNLEGVVVGQVVETRSHPNADRLTLCDVDLGPVAEDGEPVQIVCGAPNVAAGQKVPVATVGTTLMLPSRDDPDEKVPVTIKKAKLRGEVSRGMICAEDELGLSDDHAGIMVLDDAAEVGQPFAAYLAAKGVEPVDYAIDIAITPNRPDAVSHLGVARDMAAHTGLPLKKPDLVLPQDGGEAAEQVTVEIEAPNACPRYVALLVRDVTVQESPAWLKHRLTTAGLRPINTVVDVTNYVMLECGQPLHAFDYDELHRQKIVVRMAEPGETFTTLDSKERTLPADTLLICDGERPVAIAGIMGGENSEVTDATTNLLIESAYFDPSTTRKAAKALGMQTDASYRFERGVDTAGQVGAATRAAYLIAELSGGTVVPGMVDAHPQPQTPPTLDLRLSRAEQVIGMPVAADNAERILTALGFDIKHADEGALRCTVPTFRPDVEREIDLIEEVARHLGYDNIPEPAHTRLPSRTPREQADEALRRQARRLLAGLGFREIYTNSLLPRPVSERFNQPVLGGSGDAGTIVETLKPISQDMATLRPSLLPGTLEVMRHNSNHGQAVLRVQEFGHVFQRSSTGDGPVPGYEEHEALLLALSGPRRPGHWSAEGKTADVFDLKGTVEQLLADLGLADAVTMTPEHDATDVSRYHLALTLDGRRAGVLARLPDALADAYDLRNPVFYAELDWALLTEHAVGPGSETYTAFSRFPTVERDLAVLVPKGQAVGPMLDAIREAGQPLLRGAAVFDLYEGQGIPDDQKSVAFTVRLGADRTLKDAEVDAQVDAIVQQLSDRFGAQLRQ